MPVDEREASQSSSPERDANHQSGKHTTVGEKPQEQTGPLVPERAAPEAMSEHLMESEHRGRYLWAASLADGLDVIDAGCGTGYGTEILAGAGAARAVGVDISDEAVGYARSNATHANSEFRVGSLHELPFADGEFDLAVCFEVIEHVEDQSLAIAELRRVLKPVGVLAISSPNRDVYPPGNPHHIHEYVPDELAQVLSRSFANVRLYRQSPWLGAAILDDVESLAVGVEDALSPTLVKIASVEPGEEMYTVALASDGPLPEPESVVLLGEPFEVRWWQEQLAARGAEAAAQEKRLLAREASIREEFLIAAREAATLRQQSAAAHEREARSADRVLQVEALLAGAHARVAALEEAYDSHQNQIAQLSGRVDRADRVLAAMKASVSWRLTAPLRALKRWR